MIDTHPHPQSDTEGITTMISEPTSHAHPLQSAVPEILSASPEIQLATATCAHDAIQFLSGTRHDDESAGRWLDEGGASVSAPPEEDSSRVAHRRTLQRAVAEYTRQMRKLGHYPEKVLVAVKSTVRDIARPVIDKPVLETLVGDAAQWAIAAYFDTNLETGKR